MSSPPNEGVLGVSVMDQELGRCGLVLEREGEVPPLLGYRGGVGMRGDSREMDALVDSSMKKST